MSERRLVVPRTARYRVVAPTDGGPVREAWLACHGYGQLAEHFARHFEAIAAPGRLVVVPEGPSRFYVDDGLGGGEPGTFRRPGASWMTREMREDEIDDTVRLLDAVFADALERAATPDPPHIVAFGFSQGAAAATRWAARSPMLAHRRPDCVICWGGAPAHDLDWAAHRAWLRCTDLVLVLGEADPLITPERVAPVAAALEEHGIPFRRVSYPGDHRIDRDVLRSIADAPPPAGKDTSASAELT